ncbi:hypothetical protein [Rubritalea tangerina]|uniref:Uncharacterized protein n=1 Tax=Rubritalea tangerina TaxID=430798 RepID=A0ABW4ZBR6_9BACT
MKVLLVATLLSGSVLAGSTRIDGDGERETNVSIDQSFGDFISAEQSGFKVTDGGTPNIGLSWAGGSWEYHKWGGSPYAKGAVMQIEGATVGAQHVLRFEVNASDCQLTIHGFNFIGDTEGDSYAYDVAIVRSSDREVVHSQKFGEWVTDHGKAFSGAPQVVLGFVGEPGQSYELVLKRTGGEGNAHNLAIDNILYSQERKKLFKGEALVGIGGITVGTRTK